MPNVVGIFGRDNMIRFAGSDFICGRRLGLDWFFDEPPDGGRADFCAGDGEEIGNAFLAHERAEDFEALDDVMGKVRKLIDRN